MRSNGNRKPAAATGWTVVTKAKEPPEVKSVRVVKSAPRTGSVSVAVVKRAVATTLAAKK